MSVPFRFDLKIRGFFLKVGKTFDWDRIEIFKNIVVFFLTASNSLLLRSKA